MDSEALVKDRLLNDGRKVLRLLTMSNFPLAGACWAKRYDEDRWTLYVATPRVDNPGISVAYSELLKLLPALEDVEVTNSDITLVGLTHPIADDILTVRSMKQAVGRWKAGHPFGGTPFEEMYVYPPNAAAELAVV